MRSYCKNHKHSSVSHNYQTQRQHPSTHLSQPPPDRPRLLLAEVEGDVLLALVELAEVLARLLVHDGEYAGDGFADGVAVVWGMCY